MPPPSVKTILIADDSANVRYVIREFLKDVPDIEICGEAVDGLDAIEKAKKFKPNLKPVIGFSDDAKIRINTGEEW